MCGRYTLTVDQEALQVALGVEGLVHPRPRYNVAPGQEVPAVVHGERGAEGTVLRWGLVPSWASDPSIGNRLINARSETAHRKPSFRAAFREGRCLIPVDGFYEWQDTPSGKQPYRVRLADEPVFTLAGLSERWVSPEGGLLRTFTILTTDANERLRPVHDRMPVIVPVDGRARWLAPDADPDELREMLVPAPEEHILVEAASRRVNSVANDDPACLESPPPDARPPGPNPDAGPPGSAPGEVQRDLFGGSGSA